MRYLFPFIAICLNFTIQPSIASEFSVEKIYSSLDTIDYFIKNEEFKEGLKIAQSIISEAHKRNMQNVSDLSYVYDKKADCEEALNLTDDLELTLRRNVVIRENSLRPDDIMLAFSYSRLAFLLKKKSNYEESIFYEEKAASIFKILKEVEFYTGSIISIAMDYESWSGSSNFVYSMQKPNLSEHSRSKLILSIKFFSTALGLEEKPDYNYSSIHRNIATSYAKLKDYKKAIFHHLQELKFDPDDKGKLRGNTYFALSNLYSYLDDKKKALEYAYKDFEYHKLKAKSGNDLSKLHLSLANKILSLLSNAFEDSELTEQYFHHMETAHRLDKSSMEITFNLSHMYSKHDKIEKSIIVLKETLDTFLEFNLSSAYLNLRLGKHYFEMGDEILGRERIEDSFSFIRSRNDITLKQKFEYYILHATSLKNENPQKALDVLSEFKRMLINSDNNTLNIQLAEVEGYIGECYLNMGNLSSALIHMENQLNLYRNTEVYEEHEFQKLAYESVKSSPEFNNLHELSSKFINKTAKELRISNSLARLAHVLLALGRYDESNKFLERSYSIMKQLKNSSFAEIGKFDLLCLSNIYLDNPSMFDHYLKERLNIVERTLSESFSVISKNKRLDALKSMDPFLFLGNSRDTNFVSETSLKFKGIVLESIIGKSVKNINDDTVKPAVSEIDVANLITSDTSIIDFIKLTKISPSYGTGAILSFEEDKCTISGFTEETHNSIFTKVEIGDQIIAIGEDIKSMKSITGLNPSEIIDLMSGSKNSSVIVQILRSNQQKIYALNRSTTLKKLNFSPFIGATIYSQKPDSKTWIELPDPTASKEDITFNSSYDFSNLAPNELKDIYNILLKPIIDELPSNIKTLIICPDGDLNFIPFHCLIDGNNSFLAENYEILQVSALRDLHVRGTNHNKFNNISIFASPDFDKSSITDHNELAINSFDNLTTRNLTFSSLPGTLKEASLIKSIASKRGISVNTNIGADASEASLYEIKSPSILHFATHGFFGFFDEHKKQDKIIDLFNKGISAREISNPMNRSGLLLAGSKNSRDRRKNGDFVAPENDGILFAEEASQLKLSDNWLTVLSACDTGSGVAQSGEGVLGLRRAFAIAGTHNLLLTLWPVNDSFTKDFMASFYTEALDSGNAPKAMAKVQRDWLVKLREERSISQAVKLAGPFILTFRGNPELN